MNLGISILGGGASLLFSYIFLDKEPDPIPLAGVTEGIEKIPSEKKKVRGKKKKAV